MTEAQKNQTVNKIFGSYIGNTRFVPGAAEEKDESSKKKEEELFEMVDDYVEQA
ncbi:hypothetical protein [Clostridium sp. Marseille-P2415]|uniref:hypothetical protein n=1 Tax=Clostridium sp. Marseille-P2415 TaxID=1805471 RepID=UPI0013563D7B|nr:hypothetical protein [Clostridium sp. Marseille-P2415]